MAGRAEMSVSRIAVSVVLGLRAATVPRMWMSAGRSLVATEPAVLTSLVSITATVLLDSRYIYTPLRLPNYRNYTHDT